MSHRGTNRTGGAAQGETVELPVGPERSGEPVKEMLSLFKALSDETRLRMLKLLGNGELCVCHVVAAFHMSQSKVSFHLGVLRAAGLVKDRKEGKWMHYRIDDSDLFRRLLVLSVVEKVPDEMVREDRIRLAAFMKESAPPLLPAGRCCAARA
ncbi:MAG TPA: metalloregulator ArsR/SmtB family transcription factor [Syntrophorhabdaceae bacterium]